MVNPRPKWLPTPLQVQAILSQGGFNRVYKTSKDGVVLRASFKEPKDPDAADVDLRLENALMRIGFKEGLHPILFAQSLFHAPLQFKGSVNASLMQQELPLAEVLKGTLTPPAAFDAKFAGSLYGALCAIADLGFCLTDIRPNNIVVDHQGRARLIDFGSDYIAWMDEEIWSYFAHQDERKGESCARTRGTQLYLMLLLLYAHLTEKYPQFPRAQQLAQYFQHILERSCVPLDALKVREGDLLEKVANRVKHYFKQKDLDTFLGGYVKKNKLINDQCSGKGFDVIIGGKLYQNDDVTCRPGLPRRTSGIRDYNDREYPCRKVDNSGNEVDSGLLKEYIVEADGKTAVLKKGYSNLLKKKITQRMPLTVPAMSLIW